MQECESNIARLRTTYPASAHAKRVLKLLLSVAMAKHDDAQVNSVLQTMASTNPDPFEMRIARSMKRGYDRVLPRWYFPKASRSIGSGSDVVTTHTGPFADGMAIRNYPNPFTRSTMIEFSIPEATHVSVRVFNMLGRLLTTLVDQELGSGSHRVEFVPAENATGMHIAVVMTTGGVRTSTMFRTK
ncbi:MAG: T9SS type A sorting domain-containing protein [Ignavibacteria bacterium]|nr:T9SS type A sorting domain-containing protein [Ignavibacteria bacterium]